MAAWHADTAARLQPNVWYEKPGPWRACDVGIPSNRYGLPNRGSLDALGIRMEPLDTMEYNYRGIHSDNYVNNLQLNSPDHYSPNPPVGCHLDLEKYNSQGESNHWSNRTESYRTGTNQNTSGVRETSYSQVQRNAQDHFNPQPYSGDKRRDTQTLVRKVSVPTFNRHRSLGTGVYRDSQRNTDRNTPGGDPYTDMHFYAPPKNVQSSGGTVQVRHDQNLAHDYGNDRRVIQTDPGKRVHPYQNQRLGRQSVKTAQNEVADSVVHESSVVRTVHNVESIVEATTNQYYSRRTILLGQGGGYTPISDENHNKNSIIRSVLDGSFAQARIKRYMSSNIEWNTSDINVPSNRTVVQDSEMRQHRYVLQGQSMQGSDSFDTDSQRRAVMSNGTGNFYSSHRTVNSDENVRRSTHSMQQWEQCNITCDSEVDRRLPGGHGIVQNNLRFHKPQQMNYTAEVRNEPTAASNTSEFHMDRKSYRLQQTSPNSFMLVGVCNSGQNMGRSVLEMTHKATGQIPVGQQGPINIHTNPQTHDSVESEIMRREGLNSANRVGFTAQNKDPNFPRVYLHSPNVCVNRNGFIVSCGTTMPRFEGGNSGNHIVNNARGRIVPVPVPVGMQSSGIQSESNPAGNLKKRKPRKKRNNTEQVGTDTMALDRETKKSKPRNRTKKSIPLMSQDAEDIVVEVDPPSYLALYGENEGWEEDVGNEESEIVEVDPESIVIQEFGQPMAVAPSGEGELLRECLMKSNPEHPELSVKSKITTEDSTKCKDVDSQFSHLIKDCCVLLTRCDYLLNDAQRKAARSLTIDNLVNNMKVQLGCLPKDSSQDSSSMKDSSPVEEESSTNSKVLDSTVSDQSPHNSDSKESDNTLEDSETIENVDTAAVAPDGSDSSSTDSDSASSVSGPVVGDSEAAETVYKLAEDVGEDNPSSVQAEKTNKPSERKVRKVKNLLRLTAFWETSNADVECQPRKHFISDTVVPCPPSPPRSSVSSSSSSPVCSATPTSGMNHSGYAEHGTSAPSPPTTPPISRTPPWCEDRGLGSSLALLKDVRLALVKCDSIVERIASKSVDEQTVNSAQQGAKTPVKSIADVIPDLNEVLSLKILQPVVVLDRLEDRLRRSSMQMSGGSSLCDKTLKDKTGPASISSNTSSVRDSPKHNAVISSNSSTHGLKRCYVLLERIDSRLYGHNEGKRQRLSSES